MANEKEKENSFTIGDAAKVSAVAIGGGVLGYIFAKKAGGSSASANDAEQLVDAISKLF